MIYLENHSEAQPFVIPRNDKGEAVRVTLFSTVDRARKFDAEVLDIHTSAIYHYLSVELPEGMRSGEYEYRVFAQDGNELASGLAFVGELRLPNETYNVKLEYVQYGE